MNALPNLKRITSKEHYSALDGVRGLAILLVFFGHYGELNPLSSSPSHFLRILGEIQGGGWIGVDIFFVLSGFLITGILFESRNGSRYYRRFYIRRALRLFPLFYGLCLLVVLLSWWLHVQWRWSYLAYLFYGANYAIILSPATSSIGVINVRHLWSLAVEEQFYLLWPFVVRRCKSRERLLQFTFAVMGIAFLVRLEGVKLGIPGFAIYFSSLTRMDSLAAGGALALLLRGPHRDRWISVARYSLLPFIALLVIMGTWEGGLEELGPMTMIFGYTLLALASAALISETLRPFSLAARFFNNSILRFMGKISYGLYVYHFLYVGAARPLNRFLSLQLHSRLLGGISTEVVFLGGSILIAYVSFRFYEMPFLRLKDKLAPAASEPEALQPQTAYASSS